MFTVRIIRDHQNRDGWTTRSLEDGKLGFISNIDQAISQIEAGQLWEAELIEEKEKFNILTLTHKIKD